MPSRDSNPPTNNRDSRRIVVPSRRKDGQTAESLDTLLKNTPTFVHPLEQIPKPEVVSVPKSSPVSVPEPKPIPPETPKPRAVETASTDPRDLAAIREEFGFDDIPVSSTDDTKEAQSLRGIFFVWTKQMYKQNFNGKRSKRVYNFVKDKEFLKWKDDLKWALKADMDDGESPLADVDLLNGSQKSTVTSRRPQPEIPRRRQAQQLQSQQLQPQPKLAQPKSIDIDININFGSLPPLPKIPSPTKYFKQIPFTSFKNKLLSIRLTRRQQYIAGGVALVVICLLTIPPLFLKQSPDGSGGITSTSIQNPTFSTVVPSGKNISDLGGWKRVSPPDRDAVFAFTDKINDINISVSQQPLPESFKKETDAKIAELAKNFSATDKVTVGDMAVYIGTSGKGPQSVILTKSNLLILIKSDAKIDDKQWAEYIKTLR